MYRIGVDLGGTNIAVGIVTKEGEMVHKDSIKTEADQGAEHVLSRLENFCKQIIEEKNLEIEYVGIGVPGSCDYKTGIVEFAPNIDFKNINLKDRLEKFLNLPVCVENDASCAAIGEAVSGSAKNYNYAMVLTLGTGVGAGLIVNGKVERGRIEVGHQTIDINGPACGCGNVGCFEAFSSATALIRDTKVTAYRYPDSLINKIVKNVDDIEAKTVFDAADAGDIIAKKLIQNYTFYLGVGINNLLNVHPLEVVVLGGGIAAQGETIIRPLMGFLQKRAFGGELKAEIKQAQLGNDAGIIGAAMMSDF